MSFFNFKNLAMTSSMTSSFPKSGDFVYSLLPMYIVSFKFVQALLLFKIAGEGSQRKNTKEKQNTRHRVFVNYKNTVFGWTSRDDVVQKH